MLTLVGCVPTADVEAPDPISEQARKEAFEQIDDVKLAIIKQKKEYFAESKLISDRDVDKRIVYFSLQAEEFAQNAKDKVVAATKIENVQSAVRGFCLEMNLWYNDYYSDGGINIGGFGIGARTWVIEVNDGQSSFILKEGVSAMSRYPYCFVTQSDDNEISFELVGKNVLFGDDKSKIYEAATGENILFATESYGAEWYVGLIHKKDGKIIGYSLFDRTTQLSVHSVNFVDADKKDITRDMVISFMDAYVKGEDGESKAGVAVTFNKAEIIFSVGKSEASDGTEAKKKKIGLRYFGDYGIESVQGAAVEFTSDYEGVTAEVVAEKCVIAGNEKTTSAKLGTGEKITFCDESEGYVDMYFYNGEEFIGYAVFKVAKGEDGRPCLLGLAEGVMFTYDGSTKTRITRSLIERYLKICRNDAYAE